MSGAGRLVVMAAVVAAALLGLALWFLIPSVGLGFGLRLEFLRGEAPLVRIPKVDRWKPCDIYSIRATMGEVEARIDKELGHRFTNKGARYDGISWSGVKDDSGLEIVIYPRRDWVDDDGAHQSEQSAEWVTIYVYYRGEPLKRTPSFEARELIGKWEPVQANVLGKSILHFRPDGMLEWSFYEPRRKRRTRTVSEYRVEGGLLIYRQLKHVESTADGEKVSTGFGEMRTPIAWISKDSFEWGEEPDNRARWLRVK